MQKKKKEKRNTTNRYERDDEVRGISSNEMGKSGWENIGSIANSATTLMDEFQLLKRERD